MEMTHSDLCLEHLKVNTSDFVANISEVQDSPAANTKGVSEMKQRCVLAQWHQQHDVVGQQ